MPELYFRTNAKVERLVGRELITNNTIAIFELVKNSYDAGAKTVNITFHNFLEYENDKSKIVSTGDSYIEISDDGKGMTLEEIKKYWMELGTPNKEVNKVETLNIRKKQIETVVQRVVNGEKGIGRFGVDKIGSKLIMESIDKNLTEKTYVEFDWNKFNDMDKLIEQIPCKYELLPIEGNEHSGLTLRIMNLRDEWSYRNVENIKKSMKKFLSPIEYEQDEFRIIFNYIYYKNNKKHEEKYELINDSFDYLNTFIYSKLSKEGVLFYEIMDKGEIIESEEFNQFDISTFGEVELKIYYLDKIDKSKFTKKMGIRPHEYGNIKIFKDNFRIMPYGDPNNDWLEIDRRHAQGMFRTFGSRDLIGYILLSHNAEKGNTVLKEATDRVGLIEDVPEFENFKNYIWTVIKILEDYIFTRWKKEAKETTEVIKNESMDLRKDTNDIFSSFEDILNKVEVPKEEKKTFFKLLNENKTELLKKIDTVETATKKIEKKIKIYSQIASKEGILFDMLHAIKNKLAIIESQIRDFQLEIEMAGLTLDTSQMEIAFKSITRMVEGALNKVNASKLRKEIISVDQVIDEVISSHSSLLRQENITLLNKFEVEGAYIKCSKEALKNNVFDNLLNNSIKALKNKLNKKIEINTTINNQYVEIFFSDNGVGIPEDKVPFIFSLWSSNTDGSGIGLATAKDTLEEHNGNILYVDLNKDDIKTTFLIRLPLIQK